ncbi:MAG: hypothetical protein KJ648_07310 [Candidatus Omnitrophica bacterium]|nr:hypothetical protein [Candidatus Omnitrophota bacterium]
MYKKSEEQVKRGAAAVKLVAACRKKGMTWAEIAFACRVCKLSPQLWAAGRAPAPEAFRRLQKAAA